MARAEWDYLLTALVAGSTDLRAAGEIANKIEAHIKSIEQQRDAHFAEIERARDLLTAYSLWREGLICFIPVTTDAQRERAHELACNDCDFDRTVRDALADFDRLRAKIYSTPVKGVATDTAEPF